MFAKKDGLNDIQLEEGLSVEGSRRLEEKATEVTEKKEEGKDKEKKVKATNATSTNLQDLPIDEGNTTVKKKKFEVHFPDPFMTKE